MHRASTKEILTGLVGWEVALVSERSNVSATTVYAEPKRIPYTPHEIFQKKCPTQQTRHRFASNKKRTVSHLVAENNEVSVRNCEMAHQEMPTQLED